MPDTVSSRTPEGEPNVCPVCQAIISIEPSAPSGDAPCPQCGTLLWFVNTENGVRIYESDVFNELRDRLAEVLCGGRESTPDTFDLATKIAQFIAQWWHLHFDSLDMAELIFELEGEELESKLSTDQLQAIADVAEWFSRRARGRE